MVSNSSASGKPRSANRLPRLPWTRSVFLRGFAITLSIDQMQAFFGRVASCAEWDSKEKHTFTGVIRPKYAGSDACRRAIRAGVAICSQIAIPRSVARSLGRADRAGPKIPEDRSIAIFRLSRTTMITKCVLRSDSACPMPIYNSCIVFGAMVSMRRRASMLTHRMEGRFCRQAWI